MRRTIHAKPRSTVAWQKRSSGHSGPSPAGRPFQSTTSRAPSYLSAHECSSIAVSARRKRTWPFSRAASFLLCRFPTRFYASFHPKPDGQVPVRLRSRLSRLPARRERIPSFEPIAVPASYPLGDYWRVVYATRYGCSILTSIHPNGDPPSPYLSHASSYPLRCNVRQRASTSPTIASRSRCTLWEPCPNMNNTHGLRFSSQQQRWRSYRSVAILGVRA
jgi:hypothetical protein